MSRLGPPSRCWSPTIRCLATPSAWRRPSWRGPRACRHDVVLKRVGQVTADDLFSSDAIIMGSPVYWSNMSGEVKTFFDNWQFKFGVFPEFKMKNKIGAAFATGGQISSGKEVTMLTILAAMLGNQMIVVSGGGAFGASATTEGESPGIDKKELADAQALGRRVAEVAAMLRPTSRSSPFSSRTSHRSNKITPSALSRGRCGAAVVSGRVWEGCGNQVLTGFEETMFVLGKFDEGLNILRAPAAAAGVFQTRTLALIWHGITIPARPASRTSESLIPLHKHRYMSASLQERL